MSPPAAAPPAPEDTARTIPPAPALLTGTGLPCRVCKVDDGDERVQADLHRRCMELATNKAQARRAARQPRRGPELTREQLIERLRRDRAGASAAAVTDQVGEVDQVLTADEAAVADAIARGGALATGGLSGAVGGWNTGVLDDA